MAASDSAQSIKNGVEERRRAAARGGGCRDAEDQHGNRERQDQNGHQEAAAPQRHSERRADRADHGEGRRSGGERRRDQSERRRRHRQHQPEQGAHDDERESARCPVGGAFDEDSDFERQRSGNENIERAVFVIGLEQPIESEQGREQRREPENRRTKPGQQIEVGPKRERHHCDQDEEEHRADRRAAADAPRDAQFADEEGASGGHAATSPLPLRERGWRAGPLIRPRFARPPSPARGEGFPLASAPITSSPPRRRRASVPALPRARAGHE